MRHEPDGGDATPATGRPAGRTLGAALDRMSETRFEKGCRLVEPGRIGKRDMQEAGAGRRLQLAAGALGDLLAVVDDGDARGKLVGLLEILRGEQDGDA